MTDAEYRAPLVRGWWEPGPTSYRHFEDHTALARAAKEDET